LAEDASKGPDPFDVQTVTQLARLMSRHDLCEIDLRRGEWAIRLRRGGDAVVTRPATAPAAVAADVPAVTSPASSSRGGNEAPSKKYVEIKSPSPGTFYAQPEPGAPPYVTVGSRVTPTTVVCLIEAMKLYNEVTADCSGVIAEVLVNDKQPVEFDTVLFRVDPAG
jgi:acetyl-CoA carboxylase biotin carboxyl carrier protein